MAQQDKNGWKSISKMSRFKSRITTPPPPPPLAKEEFTRIFPKRPLDFRYLLYDKKPVCLLNGVLYAMFPISDPTLGYKLTPGTFNQRVVMLNPKFITENQAIRILFGL